MVDALAEKIANDILTGGKSDEDGEEEESVVEGDGRVDELQQPLWAEEL